MTQLISQHITLWIIIGFIGQLMFTARFLAQWIASEKVKKSVLPNIFWYFSLTGGTILFLYALHKKDPVFILGQGCGLFIYIRNLYLIYKNKEQTKITTSYEQASQQATPSQ
jgi:Predicted membrane protein